MTEIETREAASGVNQPEANTGQEYSASKPHANNADQFSLGVMGPATLSAKVSRAAVEKATRADIRQFANFELREALAVVDILASLGTPVPPVSAEVQSLVDTLQSLPAGIEFDKAYINAQLASHEFLRDLAESYLVAPVYDASVSEKHGRHLAALALTAFKEHIVLSKNIAQTITA